MCTVEVLQHTRTLLLVTHILLLGWSSCMTRRDFFMSLNEEDNFLEDEDDDEGIELKTIPISRVCKTAT